MKTLNRFNALPQALNPAHVMLDPRNPVQLRSYVTRIATAVRFPSYGDGALRSWRDVLACDPHFQPEGIERNDPEQQPHTALLLTLLEMLDDVRSVQNALPRRYRDFFYRDWLGFHPAGPQADQVLLQCQLAPKQSSHKLVAGTGFRHESGAEFVLTEDLPLTQAQIADVVSLDPLDGAGPRVRLNRWQNYAKENGQVAWMAFAPQAGTVADCGLILALQGLALSSAQRHIWLQLNLDGEVPTPDEPPLRVAFSTEQGWLEPPQPRLSFTAHGLVLDVSLPADLPPLLPATQAVHGMTTDFPCVRFLPREEGDTDFWQRLSCCPLQGGVLDVTVENSRDLVVSTAMGAVAATDDSGFEPWGFLPQSGAELRIEAPELRGKSLTSVRLDWDWCGGVTDFSDYFRAYPDFQPLRVTVGDDLTLPLFGTSLTQVCPNLPLNGPITVTLNGGGSLFGHQAYPALLARASLVEASLWRRLWANCTHGLRLKKLNPPYTPRWRNLRLSYASQQSFAAGSAGVQVWHQHPLGTVTTELPTLFMPYYTCKTLALSLNPIPFDAEASLSWLLNSYSAPVADWFLVDATLCGERASLCPLPWGDGSDGLVQSGLTRLRFPPAKAGEAEKSHWLVAQWDEGANVALSLVGLHLNAGMLRWCGGDKRPWPLPPEGKWTLKVPNPAVPILYQPYHSQGGAVAEDDTAFARRVAGFLSHRDRAVLPLDYQRLVLERFPMVDAALCRPHCDLNGNEVAGQVCLAVMVRGEAPLQATIPPRPAASLVSQITSMLEELAPPQVRVHVVPPDWMSVQAEIVATIAPCIHPHHAEETVMALLLQRLSPWTDRQYPVTFAPSLPLEELERDLKSLSWLRRLNRLWLHCGDTTITLRTDDERQSTVLLPPISAHRLWYCHASPLLHMVTDDEGS